MTGSEPIIYVVLVGLSLVIGKMGFDKLWPALFSTHSSKCERHMYSLASNVLTIFNIIKPDYQDNPGVLAAMDDLNRTAAEIKKDIDEKQIKPIK